MKPATSPSALKVQTVLGDAFNVVEFEASTRTSEEAAAAIGCNVAQIAKSLIFKTVTSGEPVLVIASGPNRVDEKKVAALIGKKIERPDANFVRVVTGYAIGGVPPVGHATAMTIFIDHGLMQIPEIWAAAGTPNAVFHLTPDDLIRITGGKVADICK